MCKQRISSFFFFFLRTAPRCHPQWAFLNKIYALTILYIRFLCSNTNERCRFFERRIHRFVSVSSPYDSVSVFISFAVIICATARVLTQVVITPSRKHAIYNIDQCSFKHLFKWSKPEAVFTTFYGIRFHVLLLAFIQREGKKSIKKVLKKWSPDTFSGALKNPSYSRLVSRKVRITPVLFICLIWDEIALIPHTAHITQKALVQAKLSFIVVQECSRLSP